jgi:hypothetical protein
MEEHDRCRCGVPEALRAAIARGWRGLTLTCMPSRGPVTLVAAVPEARIAALAEGGLMVGLPGRHPCGHPAGRRIRLGLAADPETALTLDLAFADARTLAERLGRDGALRLLWTRAEDGGAARADLVTLGPVIADRLREDAAHHGEWTVADPHPAGFSRLRWWRESMRASRPRLARGDLAGAEVVIVAPARGDAPDGPPAGADLELAFPSGPPLPEAPAAIGLRFDDDEQRGLAAALAGQERVAILLLDTGGAWLAQVELELGPPSRELIGEAARRR